MCEGTGRATRLRGRVKVLGRWATTLRKRGKKKREDSRVTCECTGTVRYYVKEDRQKNEKKKEESRDV